MWGTLGLSPDWRTVGISSRQRRKAGCEGALIITIISILVITTPLEKLPHFANDERHLGCQDVLALHFHHLHQHRQCHNIVYLDMAARAINRGSLGQVSDHCCHIPPTSDVKHHLSGFKDHTIETQTRHQNNPLIL